jgi:integrase
MPILFLGLRIHDLRHTHARFGVAVGFGSSISRNLLGHAKATTTQR